MKKVINNGFGYFKLNTVALTDSGKQYEKNTILLFISSLLLCSLSLLAQQKHRLVVLPDIEA